MRHLLARGADALGLSRAEIGALRAAFKGGEDGCEEVDMDDWSGSSGGSSGCGGGGSGEEVDIDEVGMDARDEPVGMGARDEPTPETQRHSFEFVEDDFR